MFKDRIKRFKFYICVNIILATIIGIYAQDIASYVIGDSLSGYLYLQWLTILTVISIVLFLAVPILIYRFVKKSALEKQIFTLYIIANSFIGILTSMFSIFVLIMTCG